MQRLGIGVALRRRSLTSCICIRVAPTGSAAGRLDLELPAVDTRRMDRAVRRGWRTRLIYGRLVRRAVAISPAVVDRLIAGGVPRSALR